MWVVGFTLAELGEFLSARRTRQGAASRRRGLVRPIAKPSPGRWRAWFGLAAVTLRRPFIRSSEVSTRAERRTSRSGSPFPRRSSASPSPCSVVSMKACPCSRMASPSEELGVKAYLALWTAHLGHGLLIAGQDERAEASAQHALDLALTHKELGHQAYALHLRGQSPSTAQHPTWRRPRRATAKRGPSRRISACARSSPTATSASARSTAERGTARRPRST